MLPKLEFGKCYNSITVILKCVVYLSAIIFLYSLQRQGNGLRSFVCDLLDISLYSGMLVNVSVY